MSIELIISIIALIVALLGGVPGYFAIKKYIKEKPDIKISISNVIKGQTQERDKAILFLSTAVNNYGAVAQSPKYLTLKSKSMGVG